MCGPPPECPKCGARGACNCAYPKTGTKITPPEPAPPKLEMPVGWIPQDALDCMGFLADIFPKSPLSAERWMKAFHAWDKHAKKGGKK